MSHYIEIWDREDDGSYVNFPEILKEINPFGKDLKWQIIYLSAINKNDCHESMYDLEERVEEMPNGLPCEWRELCWIANQFSQVIDAIFVGHKKSQKFFKSNKIKDLCSKYEIVIDAFDTTYWGIYAKNQELIKCFNKIFADVKIYAQYPEHN